MSDQLGSYFPTAEEHSEMCEEITQLREAVESLTAECDRLKSINSDLCNKSNHYLIQNARLEEERDVLTARVAELEPDAGRYRWLRDDMDGNAQEEFIRLIAGSVLSRDDFDAAIDAAREVKS